MSYDPYLLVRNESCPYNTMFLKPKRYTNPKRLRIWGSNKILELHTLKQGEMFELRDIRMFSCFGNSLYPKARDFIFQTEMFKNKITCILEGLSSVSSQLLLHSLKFWVFMLSKKPEAGILATCSSDE